MPTKIVANPVSSIADGVRATARLTIDPELQSVTAAATTASETRALTLKPTIRAIAPNCGSSRSA